MRHAPTAATRAYAFPADEPLDERGLAAAAELSAPRARRGACAARRERCRATAEAAGLTIGADRAGDRRVRLRRVVRAHAWTSSSPSARPTRGVDDRSGQRAPRRREPARVRGACGRLARRAGAPATARASRSPTAASSRPRSCTRSARRSRRSGASTCAPLARTELHAHDGPLDADAASTCRCERCVPPARRGAAGVSGAALVGGFAADAVFGDPRRLASRRGLRAGRARAPSASATRRAAPRGVALRRRARGAGGARWPS